MKEPGLDRERAREDFWRAVELKQASPREILDQTARSVLGDDQLLWYLDMVRERCGDTTYSHSFGVAGMAVQLGLAEGDTAQLDLLMEAGLLHDLGKVDIENCILGKEGGLDKSEMKEVRRHPRSAFELLREGNGFLAEVVIRHHEYSLEFVWHRLFRDDPHLAEMVDRRYGLGSFAKKSYPRSGRDRRRFRRPVNMNRRGGRERRVNKPIIDEYARILQVCDQYDALTHDRPYRSALKREEAVSSLRRSFPLEEQRVDFLAAP